MRSIGRTVSSAIGILSFRRPRTTLGLLLVLVLAAAGEGMSVAARGDQVARAEAVETGATAGLEASIPLCAGVCLGVGRGPIATQPRSCPRWIDPTAGGRPPVRAPDVG